MKKKNLNIILFHFFKWLVNIHSNKVTKFFFKVTRSLSVIVRLRDREGPASPARAARFLPLRARIELARNRIARTHALRRRTLVAVMNYVYP